MTWLAEQSATITAQRVGAALEINPMLVLKAPPEEWTFYLAMAVSRNRDEAKAQAEAERKRKG